MEFFDDIVIPYEYLQQSSKLYPLIVDLVNDELEKALTIEFPSHVL